MTQNVTMRYFLSRPLKIRAMSRKTRAQSALGPDSTFLDLIFRALSSLFGKSIQRLGSLGL